MAKHRTGAHPLLTWWIRANVVLAAIWILISPVAFTVWKNSILWINFMSLMALEMASLAVVVTSITAKKVEDGAANGA